MEKVKNLVFIDTTWGYATQVMKHMEHIPHGKITTITYYIL